MIIGSPGPRVKVKGHTGELQTCCVQNAVLLPLSSQTLHIASVALAFRFHLKEINKKFACSNHMIWQRTKEFFRDQGG